MSSEIKMSKPCVLVTGGVGFIGSHTTVEICNAGYDVVVIDNLMNSKFGSLARVREITGKKIPFYKVDLLDKPALQDVFTQHNFTHVIHFAALKALSESCKIPLVYYKNNLGAMLNLLEVMQEHAVYNLVFSSSHTVYGDPQCLPISEEGHTGSCTSPYGNTKFFCEEILFDIYKSEPRWNIVSLRYFNPVGAHKSGLIGEDPKGPTTNLMPYLAQLAVGRRTHLNVYGTDYDTRDGTGIRDYIHVVDLALGHVAALGKLEETCGLKIYNLGTGKGYSVFEMLEAFSKACGKKLDYKICPRREGDVAEIYAVADLAKKEMGWEAKRDINDMCEDVWRWQSNNPDGYVNENVVRQSGSAN